MEIKNKSFEQQAARAPGPSGERVSFPKFLWQTSFLSSGRGPNIPKFLKEVRIFSGHSLKELHILSQSLFKRVFNEGEVIFHEGDLGFGFYLIAHGQVKISGQGEFVLERGEFFGELALLQERNEREISAVAMEGTCLLGLFRPGLDHLINTKPAVGVKFLQALGEVVSARFVELSKELHRLKKLPPR